MNQTVKETHPSHDTAKTVLGRRQALEKHYEEERQLIHAVSRGEAFQANLYFTRWISNPDTQKQVNSMQNIRCHCITLNTLLRRAAVAGGVHPVQIDELSKKYLKKIDRMRSINHGMPLMRDMIQSYSILVEHHTLKNYSLLIQKVIARIHADLSDDLSLRTLAKVFNINASYLSALFRKETGSTLTYYVNRSRMEYAASLLQTTDLPVKQVAQYCGIHDVNYFTKTFKKYQGKAPKEYRKDYSGIPPMLLH